MHRVAIQNTKEEYTCSSEDNLLKGMEQLNRKGIPVGCRGGSESPGPSPPSRRLGRSF